MREVEEEAGKKSEEFGDKLIGRPRPEVRLIRARIFKLKLTTGRERGS
jgi:hypothetical protein